MKNSSHFKLSFVIRCISVLLTLALLMTNYTVLSYALPKLASLISGAVEKSRLERMISDTSEGSGGSAPDPSADADLFSPMIISHIKIATPQIKSTRRRRLFLPMCSACSPDCMIMKTLPTAR